MEIAEAVEKNSSLELPSPVGIAGVDFHLVGMNSVLEMICRWRELGRRGCITLVNPHSVMLCRKYAEMKAALQRSALVLPDGIGIILAAKLLSLRHSGRISGPELMLHICDAGRRYGLAHYFYGGGDGVCFRLADQLSRRYPGLEIAGCYTPPFRDLTEDEDAAVVRRINAAGPDILWVGLGAPKQERWMAQHAERIEASAIIGVGAAFDFHSGNRPWCPAPLRNLGLEWAYRLACEPRRLWRRNIDSFLFLRRVADQLLDEEKGVA
jgi:N-acetylglucosaminyldiphosphoundecaprenol N-acetyl-beta-D-mannosaminyltransferase